MTQPSGAHIRLPLCSIFWTFPPPPPPPTRFALRTPKHSASWLRLCWCRKASAVLVTRNPLKPEKSCCLGRTVAGRYRPTGRSVGRTTSKCALGVAHRKRMADTGLARKRWKNNMGLKKVWEELTQSTTLIGVNKITEETPFTIRR